MNIATSPRIIPEWKLKSGMVILESEQVSSADASVEMSQIKLHNPAYNGWITYGRVYSRMRRRIGKTWFLNTDHINHLLSKADEFPEEWKRFRIELWGHLFRGKAYGREGHAFVKYLYFCEENEVWLVGSSILTTYSCGKPLEESVTTLQSDTDVRIAFVE